ncbi:hypothetical protein [Modestobacter versicolor]|uniref:Uncharacterized protein n=1 Tax=Modestobacter versicolor TaxID=429133 RepID=A0A323V4J9_9ACTN|nr:hypothetical protein [Modestobacter versicolor]PZA19735.1 hypothetical protein DMO24_19185 [Modestobacter versicolor]
MALLLTYRLTAESPEQVAYEFGSSPEDMTGQVLVDPRDPDRELPGRGDPGLQRTVAGKVTLRWMREGTWPRGGAIQS